MSALTRETLAAITLFADLNGDDLDRLLDRHRQSDHQIDQVIVMEQDWGESLFLIRDGLAKVRTTTADGDEVIMSLLGPGEAHRTPA
jgi:cAMP-binding proteins - catabolite gene activator and regulatory subunit of cAMP-dependent protein kinases